MSSFDVECLLDNFISNECLDNQINITKCLKLLNLLLNVKNTRIMNEKCERIVLSVLQICKQEEENIDLQCEVVRTALLVTVNSTEEILSIISYLNCETKNFVNQTTKALTKIGKLLNEVLHFCNTQNKKEIFKGNIIPTNINKFLLHNLSQKNNSLKIYITSYILQNYISLLSNTDQVYFFEEIFSQCRINKNFDVLCIVSNYVTTEVLLTADEQSILYKESFWKFLSHSISDVDNIVLHKQATFILEKFIKEYYDNSITSLVNIPFLNINKLSEDDPKKIWQNFFILLDITKETQLHIIHPSLKFIQSMKYLNPLWQKCIYKILLNIKQNSVMCFMVSHVMQENIDFQSLYKYFLLAINKIDYSGCSTQIHAKLPLFCSKLEQFSFFLECILEIPWAPTAMWYFFSNLFISKLEKSIPHIFFQPIYKLTEKLPHIYIRNGCMNLFIIYFINSYDWNHNFDESCKILFILKDYDEKLLTKVVLTRTDINFLNNIVKTLESIQNNSFDLKKFDLFVHILKICEYNVGLQVIYNNSARFNKELLTAVYFNFFDYYDITDMQKFVENNIDNIDMSCIDMFVNVSSKLMAFKDFDKKMYPKIINILVEPKNYSQSSIYTAFCLVKLFKPDSSIKTIVDEWKTKFLLIGKTDDNLMMYFIELYFLTNKNVDILFLEYVFNSQSDMVIIKIFEKFSTIVSYEENPDEVVSFLRIGLNVVQNLTKSSHFKAAVFNYINCVFSINLFKVLFKLEMLDIIPKIIDSLVELSQTFPIISYYLSQKIKYFILCSDYDNNYSSILVPVIIELLLQGIVIKKEERVEYLVCQQIYEKKIGHKEDNPNMKKTFTRLYSLESMLEIVKKSYHLGENFALHLMEKYKIYFNKRYFPDSQIHLQKLRIIQALLTIHPFINVQKQALIDFIMESFCIEIHQPCVKQLMQWLLYYLLKDNGDTSLFTIMAKIDSSTKTQPSTIVAFIVVLFHLTLSKPESSWYPTIEALLPWCMGAHFKLRVYSQAAIRKLFKEARQKSYHNFLNKYDFLEKSINSVVDASGQAYYETLKSDNLFFDVFNSERDYSLQTIYVDIPKLNGITKTEWENIMLHDFTICGVIKILNKDKTFSNSVIDENIKKTSEEIVNSNNIDNTYNIQRKITPWKTVMEEQGKQLGDFILIASLLDKLTNLGGLSRTCEVFGVQQLVLNDSKIRKDKEFTSLSMSSENWVDILEVKTADLKTFIVDIRERGYCVIGAEQTSESVKLNEYRFKKKTALLLGNEKEGIPPDIIPILDACIEIPQFGMVRSLNVHVAGATFIWEYVKQHLV